MILVTAPQELADVARRLGVREDWHEPDEQNVDAIVIGAHLDNAMRPREADLDRHYDGVVDGELNVVIQLDGDRYAMVSLADLLAWASSWGERVALSGAEAS